jgi:glycogen synthase
MKLLVYSPAFLPHLGGLEINIAQFSEAMVRLGCEVVVITQTAGPASDAPYRVVRRPTARELLCWARWCDLYYQANVSLRGLWPLFLVRRPWAVSHHSWYRQEGGHIAWQDRLKRFLLRFAAVSISVSQGVAADLATPSVVIPNAYRDHLFRVLPHEARTRELVFLGRLVSDKGMDILIDALDILAHRGQHPRLTVIGQGPEAPQLCASVAHRGLSSQVEFVGLRADEELVRLLNRHRIVVVPSRYNEPFGIVALEGIACGCVVVGSRGGGLPEAIGPCGRTFKNGDAEDLARVLTDLLADLDGLEAILEEAPRHLAEHRSDRVARLYLAELSRALQI